MTISQYTLYNATSEMDLDIPRPTVNGGYTHTRVSRQKISLANRGKVPWNKGKNRSEEVKAKIAAGVRRKNRERFLQKLASLNMTEEEWEQQEAEASRAQTQERLARRTSKGGYSPTDETRRKISEVLKNKFATGEIMRRPVDPDKVRRGFNHSEETRAKISESLRHRWATDDGYRASMKQAKSLVSSKEEIRQKISQTLREKWQDREFREAMLEKMANSTRRRAAASGEHPMRYDTDHRQRISDAMKEKWQDEAYRSKTLESIAKQRQAKVAQQRQRQQQAQRQRPLKRDVASKSSSRPASADLLPSRDVQYPSPEVFRARAGSAMREIAARGDGSRLLATTALKPLEPKAVVPRLNQRSTPDGTGAGHVPIAGSPSTTKPTAHVSELDSSASSGDGGVSSIISPPAKKSMASKKGDMARLKVERRDLYDLLYGDDDDYEDDEGDGGDEDDLALSVRDDESRVMRSRVPLHEDRDVSGSFLSPDEDLSQFDPYGLRDY